MRLELPVDVHPLLEWIPSGISATAEELDRNATSLRRSYQALAQAGWIELGGSRRPESGFRYLPELVARSGALALLLSRQWLANQSLVVPDEEPWPKAGIAYGHLRHTDRPAPLYENGKVYGRIPWMVGSGIFDYVLLGFRDLDGNEMLAWVEAHDRAEFRHSEALQTVACRSAGIVWVDCQDLEVPEDSITRIGPLGTLAKKEAREVIFQVPLLLGVAEAAATALDNRPDRAPRAMKIVRDLRRRAERCLEGGSPEEARQLRAEAGAWAMRLSLLSTMASGCYALLSDRDPQRLYREALLFNLLDEEERIVHAMADHLLGSG